MTLVFLHHLGGSAETWKPVEERLSKRFPCVRLDLPGFGDASGEQGRRVAGMADWVQAHVADRVRGPWILVGHSMSAKIALLVARRQHAAADAQAPLAGLVLAAGSPPAPEPMDRKKREEMLGWFEGDDAQSRKEADGYVTANVSRALEKSLHERAVGDVLRSSRHAWRNWLEAGSLEDLRETVGRLDIPALVLAGEDDEALGQKVQRDQMLPHLDAGRLEIVSDAAHLLPMEQPDRVAALIATFSDELGDKLSAPRMTRRTMALLEKRGQSDAAYAPQVLDETAFAALQRLVRHVLPMPDGITIDLAARLDARLVEAVGDGWRFAMLPPDDEAYRRALSALETVARREHEAGFAALDDTAVDALVRKLSSGALELGQGFLSADALQHWFEEVRGDCCQLFLTHPAVEARANIIAAATGGDEALLGFNRIKAGASEHWEDAVWREHG